jgi:hypothetical protein
MGSLSVVVVWCMVVRKPNTSLVYLPSLTKSSATKSDVTYLVSRKVIVVCIDGYQTRSHTLTQTMPNSDVPHFGSQCLFYNWFWLL